MFCVPGTRWATAGPGGNNAHRPRTAIVGHAGPGPDNGNMRPKPRLLGQVSTISAEPVRTAVC